jgi:catechol 2,3-dioxygenase-like lactoylglutathione lyase family enzyme
MLNTAKLICFAATTHPEEARTFYADTLGLTLVEESPFAIVFDANGTMLRIQKVRQLAPASHTALGWEVSDIRAAVRQLAERGVGAERFGGLEQDELGLWTTPDGSKVAWFKDPDGNTVSLTEFRS